MAKMQQQYQDQGIPESLWPKLDAKISGQLFDAGAAFSLAEDDSIPDGLCLVAARDIAKHEDVWLVDHMLSLPQEGSAEVLLEQVRLSFRICAPTVTRDDQSLPMSLFVMLCFCS